MPFHWREFLSLKVAETQNDQGWKGSLEVIWSNPPVQAWPRRVSCPGPCLDSFWISSRRRIHNLSGQLVPVRGQPHSEKVFPDVQREPPLFQCVPGASGPVTGHHWKEPGSILFAPFLQVFISIEKTPLSLLFSRLNSPSSLSLSS